MSLLNIGTNLINKINAVNKYKATWENGKNYIYVGSSSNTIKCGSLQITHGMVENNQWDFVCNESEFNKCVEEMTNMNIKLIYTKEMVDAGVMPSVGMEVMHLAVKKVVMLPADLNSKYVLNSVNDFYSLALIHDIKPLDTRTDKEKALDGLSWNGEGLTAKACVLALDLIMSGKVHGVTFTGSK